LEHTKEPNNEKESGTKFTLKQSIQEKQGDKKYSQI